MTTEQVLNLLQLGLDYPGKNLQWASVPVEPKVVVAGAPASGKTGGEAQEGTKASGQLSDTSLDSCGPLQSPFCGGVDERVKEQRSLIRRAPSTESPLEQELHKLEQHYGLPPREPVTLQECLYELSRRMSGLEVQPTDWTKP